MTITAQQLREDFPEFADELTYPNSGIAFWINLATLMLNTDRWLSPAGYASVTAAIFNPGVDYAVGDTISLAGGTQVTNGQPTVITVLTIGPGGAIATCKVTQLGVYAVLPSNPAAQASTTGSGTGAKFNMAYVANPNTTYDVGMELFVAHQMALEARAKKEASVGGIPGGQVGVLTAKSVDKVSASYDVSATLNPRDGHWNLTSYGIRFAWMMKMTGSGAMYVGAGICAPPYTFGAWSGPPSWPGAPGWSG